MDFLKRIIREPLLHFLLIGAALFAVYAMVDDTPAPVDPDRISISEPEVEALSSSFSRTWRRPPSDSELAALIEDRVREEVLVREAIALGMDQNDTVIRRRLRQKMEFLTASIVESMEPEEEKVQAFYKDNQASFELPGRVAFKQVFLGENPAKAEIDQALDTLKSGTEPSGVGARTLIPPSLPLSGEHSIDGTFGRGFFQSLADLPDETWAGPVTSGYGTHLVFISERQPPVVPPLDSVRDKVIQAWRAETQKQLLEDQFRQMKARYDISVPGPGSDREAAK